MIINAFNTSCHIFDDLDSYRFHATCVGISREEAEQLESYWCPACEKNKATHDDPLTQRMIERHHWEILKQVWNNVKVC